MEQSKPVISLIAAMAKNRAIGIENRLPWHLPADLQHFKKLTLGKPILMGRRTWESLPGLLPQRPHIVITRDPQYLAEGATVVHSIDSALAAAGDVPEVMIVGGAHFYQQMLPLADRLYLTEVEVDVEGDAFFPEFELSDWQLLSHETNQPDEKSGFAYTFLTYQRTNAHLPS